MKRIILKILHSIRDFFNKMSDQEAKRVIGFYNHLFTSRSDEAPGPIGSAGVRFRERR